MASGETAAEGLPFYMAATGLALYTVSLLGIGTGGILMWKDLIGKRK